METSGLLYSAMFCINQKNAFLICKSSFFFLIAKVIPLKIEKIKHLIIIVHLLRILLMKISSTVLLLIQYRFHIVFEPACLRIACLRACLCAGRQARRQTGRQASRKAGRSECGQACRPACVCPHAFAFTRTHTQVGLQAFIRI